MNSIGNAANNTVQSALADPVGTIIKGAAIASGQPELMALANAGVAVANGASLEDAALAAGKGYAAGAIGSQVSSGLSPELTSNGMSASDAALTSKLAGQVAGATATGGDPLKALVAGGVGAGVSEIASQVPGFEDMNKYQQNAVTKAISSTIQGRDPTQGLINEAIASGIDAVKNSAPSSDLLSQTLPDQTNAVTNNPQAAEDYTPPPSLTLDDLYKQTTPAEPTPAPAEPTPAPAAPAAETPASTEQANPPQPAPAAPAAQSIDEQQKAADAINAANTANEIATPVEPAPAAPAPEAPVATTPETPATPQQGYYDEITGKFIPSDVGNPQLDNTSGTGTMDGWTYDSTTQTWTDPSGTTTDLSYLSNKQTPMDTSTKTTPSDLSRFLLNQGTLSNLLKYGGAAAGIGTLLNNGSGATQPAAPAPGPTQTVDWNPQVGTMKDGVAYGLAQLQPTFTKHAAQGGIMSLGGYASGGNPRLLKGPGDGMSDNIPATIAGKQPARLADGEFVIPADVVSHLGNGSTEAGANVLHQMMERVRKARTGNPHQGRQINPQKYLPGKGK